MVRAPWRLVSGGRSRPTSLLFVVRINISRDSSGGWFLLGILNTRLLLLFYKFCENIECYVAR